jgi:hypothetical protein
VKWTYICLSGPREVLSEVRNGCSVAVGEAWQRKHEYLDGILLFGSHLLKMSTAMALARIFFQLWRWRVWLVVHRGMSWGWKRDRARWRKDIVSV